MRIAPRLAPLVAVAALAAAPAHAQSLTTLFFENSGIELGITQPGTSTFSVAGSNWDGGIVATMGILPLYASGQYSYEVFDGNTATITFDDPMDRVRFFYVHGFGFSPGTATVYDAAGNVIGSASSNQATFFNDPGNYEMIDPAAPIARVEVANGVVDNFSYETESDTPAGSPLIASQHHLSVSAGGVQTLALDAGAANAGKLYWILGTLSGPGAFPVDGVVLPLNVLAGPAIDPWTLFTVSNANTPPLGATLATLDAQGQATATFSIPAGTDPTLAGATFHHAFLLFNGAVFDFASNAEFVTLIR